MTNKKIFESFRSNIGQNIIILLISNFFVFLFTFFAITYVNRNLSPAEYGTFSIISFYLLVAQNITDFGLNVNGVKYIINNVKTESEIIWNIWFLKIIVFFISTPTLLLIAYGIHILYPAILGKTEYQPITLISYIALAIINVILLSTKSTIDILQQVRHENQYKAISEAVSALVKLICFALIFYIGKTTIWAFMFGILFSSIIALVLTIVMYRKKIPVFSKPNKKIMQFLFTATIFTALLMISNYLLGEVNKVVLDIVQTPYEVGIFAPPQKIFSIVLVIPNVIMIPIYSEITRYIKNHAKLKGIVVKSAIILLGVAVMGSIFTYIVAPFVIDFMGGYAFKDSIPVLRVVALSFPAMFLHHLFGYILIAKNKEKQYFLLSFSAVILCIILAFVLGGAYGALGMAWVLVIIEVGICVGTGLSIL
ncbi:MAG TPA: oligosaccharide flippase family protein [Candidatus Dojkabacteria bacterium]|nr:oligosaccharide flippase family protein [Candidatus Dojkabacteria bacterium]HQF36394.1 oligosaccharide flippase family protein [Candidatus Dojkabacteria bacterium]